LFGYTHLLGGYPGGQAEYVRVPFADVGPLQVPDDLEDEKVLFLSDVLPTGYMAAENCKIQPGDTIAIWGCGPVGLFAAACCRLLGAERIIVIDRIRERLRLAAEHAGAVPLNYEEAADVVEELKQMTGGRGPDACIDAVGMEAHGHSIGAAIEKAKHTIHLEADRLTALRQAIQACRKGGIISVPGVYGGILDKIPLGTAFNKGLTFAMGQTNVHKYMRPLLERIRKEEIDPSFIITHRMSLEEAPRGFEIFKNKKDSCVKVVMTPDGNGKE
jgi:threonine dehydrogenase-like Zn-dependent dehydrogenase